MSLEHLKITRNIIHPITVIALINFVLVVLLLMMATSVLATPRGIDLRFPLANAGANNEGAAITIKITGENVIYVDGKVVTLSELRKGLASINLRNRAIMVKADRRASMGRVSDIWDLCRGIPGAKVHVSTSH